MFGKRFRFIHGWIVGVQANPGHDVAMVSYLIDEDYRRWREAREEEESPI
ncbi:MAG: hypothetical protein FWG26_07345 [Betaproteobacteria bacterium]|nr:hypothetical protein [Betaproteobacteria bacterium]